MAARMRRFVMAHFRLLVNTLLVASSLALLVLLGWGIGVSNITAAVVAGAGLAVVIVAGGSALMAPDDLRSQATERTLRVASGTLRQMSAGLSPESAMAVCQLVLPETTASAIAISDDRRTIAFVGDDLSGFKVGAPNSDPTREVLSSGHVQTFTNLDWDEWADMEVGLSRDAREQVLPVGIIAPLEVAGRPVGTFKLYYRHGRDVDRTQLAIARGFAELLSTQLSAYELDRQAELTARAEVKALQAQINPHFLFNALNTMASLTRTDPSRARELLREFAVFYRRTLESSEQLIPLEEELEQTRRYLKIEKARFGDDRIVETERVEPGCGKVRVPGFLVQPIVENAVRHAMSDEGPLHIDVQVVSDGGDVLIAVADDGLGMSEEVANGLLEASAEGRGMSQSDKGTGIALRNVAERIERFFGMGSGVEIMSREGAGTCVTLRLVGAAPTGGAG
ncbi:ATPase/histidine kinase/DNA gyrase B/HSP90 domain protein [Olsenella sp. DNF00959]|nr:ATPase/histidine kinase/DNA gyrase B/HSP90 domain protein [Olsenella sp. DNF00959]